jgi:hypothetical protein
MAMPSDLEPGRNPGNARENADVACAPGERGERADLDAQSTSLDSMYACASPP